MRNFAKVAPALWHRKDFRVLGDCARLLYIYAISSPHSNSCGCYELPMEYALADLKWSAARYQAAFEKLTAARFIEFDNSTSEIRIVDWLAINSPSNEKHKIGMARAIGEIKSEKFRQACAQALNEAWAGTIGSIAARNGMSRPTAQRTMPLAINGGRAR